MRTVSLGHIFCMILLEIFKKNHFIVHYLKEVVMRYVIAWLLGIPISILVLIWLVSSIF